MKKYKLWCVDCGAGPFEVDYDCIPEGIKGFKHYDFDESADKCKSTMRYEEVNKEEPKEYSPNDEEAEEIFKIKYSEENIKKRGIKDDPVIAKEKKSIEYEKQCSICGDYFITTDNEITICIACAE